MGGGKGRGGGEKEEDRGSKVELFTDSREPDMGLEFMNGEIMT